MVQIPPIECRMLACSGWASIPGTGWKLSAGAMPSFGSRSTSV
jgi:hypothetical protein